MTGPRERAETAGVDMLSILRSLQGRVVNSGDEIYRILSSPGPVRVQTVNLFHLFLASRLPEMLTALQQADRISADGWPVAWALSNRIRTIPRVTGSDLVVKLTSVPHHRRIALIGASVTAGDTFEELIAEQGGQIVFREHGHAKDFDIPSLASASYEAGAQLLLVAITSPPGELIASAIRETGLPLAIINVGAGVDMVTGNARRAPKWAQKSNLEWIYRLIQEPRRLFVRYVMQCGPLFLTEVVPAVIRLRRSM